MKHFNIKNLIKNSYPKSLNAPENDKMDQRILTDALATMKKTTKTKSATIKPNIWRTYMKSKIAKLTTAAVIIMGVIIGINQFGGSIDMATVAFAEMNEAMKKMPWMHGVIELKYPDKIDRHETWISFESQVQISKRSSEQITNSDVTKKISLFTYSDMAKKISQLYDPVSKTITMSYISDDKTIEQAGSVLGFWEMITKQFSDADAEVSQEIYQGKKVNIYKIDSSPSGTPMEIRITVDTQTNLPVLLNQKLYDSNGKLTTEANGYFDYPESGPANIYEIGVPRSAKVVNNLPTKDIHTILDAYRSHRESSPSDYTALVTKSWFDKKFGTFLTHGTSVVYRDGKIQRVNNFTLTGEKDWRETFLKFEKEMGNTFESQLTWWTQNGPLSNINLYDGKFQYQLERQNEKWIAKPKRYMPLGDYRGDDDLADFGWSVHFILLSSNSSPFIIVENEYSKKHNLICLESAAQGKIQKDKGTQKTWAIPPKMIRCYLNPERDYICQRFEQHELFDAPWQKDKTWFEQIKQDNIKKSWAINEIREVVEFGQTEDKQWYPKVIKTWDPTDTNDGNDGGIKKIWLRTDLEFPEGIFDPENLPR